MLDGHSPLYQSAYLETWFPEFFLDLYDVAENFKERGLIANCKIKSVILVIGPEYLQRISQKFLKFANSKN